MLRKFMAGLLFVATLPCLCQESERAAVAGYVTRVASVTDFDVDGEHVLFGPKSQLQTVSPLAGGGKQWASTPLSELKPYLGEPMEIFGELNAKSHVVSVNRIVQQAPQVRTVTGLAIIDAVLPLPANASPTEDRLIRADGYPILITAKTSSHFNAPLSTATDIGANLWVEFKGVQRVDGIVVAEKVSFSKNTIGRGEDKLREKKEYDPAAVDPDKKQSVLSKQFRGIDPKQIPPYKDDAMQARVSAIGAKLVPKYQFDFPFTEETRIDFRFQVIDNPKWSDAMTLPNGIILVPRQVVERMQNDSQLATVLADNIACALEKQPLIGRNQAVDMTAANLAGTAAGLIVPGLGLLTQVTTGVTAVKLRHIAEQQSGRVSISLLHDAGYEIDQAPLAWWLLASRKPRNISEIAVPQRALYLYQFLGETWPPARSEPPAQAQAMP